MSKILRSKSTDLSVLRSILLDEDDLSRVDNKEFDEENDKIDHGTVKEIDINNKYDSPCLDINQCNESVRTKNLGNKKTSKIEKDSSERQPFFVSRINSHHKDITQNTVKSKENLISVETNELIYKSVHYKNIVQKEERLQLKYRQLAEILQKDVVSRTAAICDQSINEARQLIQNSLAASRIVSSFIVDRNNFGLLSNKEEISFPKAVDPVVSEIHIPITADPFQPSVTNELTNVFGYEVPSTRDSLNKAASDNRLVSDEPFIQQWLQSKDREEREQRRMRRKQCKVERVVQMNAERVLEQRKSASEEAFKSWCRRKSRSARRPPISQSDETRSGSPESSGEDSIPQAGRQPRPTHNFVYRRPLTRPHTSATFTIRTDLKMKLTGHKVDLMMANTSRSVTRLQPIINNGYRPQTAVPRPRQDVRVGAVATTKKGMRNVVSTKSPIRTSMRKSTRRRKIKCECMFVENRENREPCCEGDKGCVDGSCESAEDDGVDGGCEAVADEDVDESVDGGCVPAKDEGVDGGCEPVGDEEVELCVDVGCDPVTDEVEESVDGGCVPAEDEEEDVISNGSYGSDFD